MAMTDERRDREVEMAPSGRLLARLAAEQEIPASWTRMLSPAPPRVGELLWYDDDVVLRGWYLGVNDVVSPPAIIHGARVPQEVIELLRAIDRVEGTTSLL